MTMIRSIRMLTPFQRILCSRSPYSKYTLWVMLGSLTRRDGPPAAKDAKGAAIKQFDGGVWWLGLNAPQAERR